MKHDITRILAATGLIVMAFGASGCAKVRGYQGYVVDSVLMDSVQAGVDNRASVEKTLGKPTFFGQFAASDWYYVSRQTRQYAFTNPRPSEQTVMRIRFNEAGNVVSVDRAGVDRVASIRPSGDKTPTLGKTRGFFEDLFGGIGQVGSVGQGGGSADNPDQ
jgi:outer membrane protein assembly factor BamE (lipoprotein component of BamABCDE complex)